MLIRYIVMTESLTQSRSGIEGMVLFPVQYSFTDFTTSPKTNPRSPMKTRHILSYMQGKSILTVITA